MRTTTVFVHTVRPNGSHTFSRLFALPAHDKRNNAFKLPTLGAHTPRLRAS